MKTNSERQSNQVLNPSPYLRREPKANSVKRKKSDIIDLLLKNKSDIPASIQKTMIDFYYDLAINEIKSVASVSRVEELCELIKMLSSLPRNSIPYETKQFIVLYSLNKCQMLKRDLYNQVKMIKDKDRSNALHQRISNFLFDLTDLCDALITNQINHSTMLSELQKKYHRNHV
jgi:hypothetical protein